MRRLRLLEVASLRVSLKYRQCRLTTQSEILYHLREQRKRQRMEEDREQAKSRTKGEWIEEMVVVIAVVIVRGATNGGGLEDAQAPPA